VIDNYGTRGGLWDAKGKGFATQQWDKLAAKDAPTAKAVGMMKDFKIKLGHLD
jgi:hypothetical protein